MHQGHWVRFQKIPRVPWPGVAVLQVFKERHVERVKEALKCDAEI